MSMPLQKKSMDALNRIHATEYQLYANKNLVVVLDNVRSQNNVGSVFRTADAFGIGKIWLCGITGTPPHPELRKTALGAEESVLWEYGKNTAEILKQLKCQEFTIAAVEQAEPGTWLPDFKSYTPETKLALVFGHEVNGVSEEALSECDLALEIPQSGSKHSLNISVAVGITLYHVAVSLSRKP